MLRLLPCHAPPDVPRPSHALPAFGKPKVYVERSNELIYCSGDLLFRFARTHEGSSGTREKFWLHGLKIR